MEAFLLDTNHVGLAVDGSSIVSHRIFQARLKGIRIGTCLPVLCEIEAGIRQVRRKAKYRRDLNHLLGLTIFSDSVTAWTCAWASTERGARAGGRYKTRSIPGS